MVWDAKIWCLDNANAIQGTLESNKVLENKIVGFSMKEF